jgi:hypothetical protein
MVEKFPRACEALVSTTDRLYNMADFTPKLLVDAVLDVAKIGQEFM